jgi:peptidoglycan L-alanyl-D-glutamate endopeptidase CwlK
MPPVNFEHANLEFLPTGYPYGFLFRRVFLGLYYPAFRAKVIAAKTKLAEQGKFFWSIYGFRSFAEQAKLRDAYLNRKGGRAAPPGLSAHQYGLADDSCLDGDNIAPGLQPRWDAPGYADLGAELAKQGLVWGGGFGDMPHANFAGYVSGAELRPLMFRWTEAQGTDEQRLRSVWNYIDGRGPGV